MKAGINSISLKSSWVVSGRFSCRSHRLIFLWHNNNHFSCLFPFFFFFFFFTRRILNSSSLHPGVFLAISSQIIDSFFFVNESSALKNPVFRCSVRSFFSRRLLQNFRLELWREKAAGWKTLWISFLHFIVRIPTISIIHQMFIDETLIPPAATPPSLLQAKLFAALSFKKPGLLTAKRVV